MGFFFDDPKGFDKAMGRDGNGKSEKDKAKEARAQAIRMEQQAKRDDLMFDQRRLHDKNRVADQIASKIVSGNAHDAADGMERLIELYTKEGKFATISKARAKVKAKAAHKSALERARSQAPRKKKTLADKAFDAAMDKLKSGWFD